MADIDRWVRSGGNVNETYPQIQPLNKSSRNSQMLGTLLPEPAQLREDNGYLKKIIDIMAAQN
jgi:hypothetical protein